MAMWTWAKVLTRSSPNHINNFIQYLTWSKILTLFLILDAVRKGNDAETSGESEVEKRVNEVLVADVAKFRCWLREECDGEVLFLVWFLFFRCWLREKCDSEVLFLVLFFLVLAARGM